MKVVAYQLENGRAPSFIITGGWLPHKYDGREWLVGFAQDSTDPAKTGVVELTEARLLARIGTMSASAAETLPDSLAAVGFTAAKDDRNNDVAFATAELEKAGLSAVVRVIQRLAIRAGI